MEYEFHVGDLVECAKPGGIDRRITTGMRGTVCNISGYSPDFIGVAWDKYIDGHSCRGKCEEGYGWNVYARDIRLVEPEETEFPVDDSELSEFLSGFVKA